MHYKWRRKQCANVEQQKEYLKTKTKEKRINKTLAEKKNENENQVIDNVDDDNKRKKAKCNVMFYFTVYHLYMTHNSRPIRLRVTTKSSWAAKKSNECRQ